MRFMAMQRLAIMLMALALMTLALLPGASLAETPEPTAGTPSAERASTPHASGGTASERTGQLTGKERLGEKWQDEQRVNNCNVPPEKRGSKPRPDDCTKPPRP